MTERPVKPLPDGMLIIFRAGRGREYPESFRFSTMKHYNLEQFGVVICYEDHRKIIPWTEIRELKVQLNSKQYAELLDKWVELDHRNHTEDEPDQDCRMCLETALSNAQPTIWVQGGPFNG